MSLKSEKNVGIAMSCMFTTLIFDGWNPTHENGDEWMVYGIAIPTLKPKWDFVELFMVG